MATGDQLQAEARARARMVVVAGIGAGLTVLSPLIGAAGLHDVPDNLPAQMLYGAHHQLPRALSLGLYAITFVAIGILLDFLLRATFARNPDLSRWLRPVPLLVALVLAILTGASQVVSALGFAHFAAHGSQTYDEAQKILGFRTLTYVGYFVELIFAGVVALVSINAMRVGLLTRMLAYIGIGAAVLLVLSPNANVLLQIYWLGALAVLFAGRWPSGTPRAWASGEAVPWPSSAEQREQRVRAAEARRGGRGASRGEQEDAIEGTATTTGAPSPATSRRKRKRRR